MGVTQNLTIKLSLFVKIHKILLSIILILIFLVLMINSPVISIKFLKVIPKKEPSEKILYKIILSINLPIVSLSIPIKTHLRETSFSSSIILNFLSNPKMYNLLKKMILINSIEMLTFNPKIIPLILLYLFPLMILTLSTGQDISISNLKIIYQSL